MFLMKGLDYLTHSQWHISNHLRYGLALVPVILQPRITQRLYFF